MMKKFVAAILLLLLCANIVWAEDFDTAFEGYVLTHVKKEMSPNWHIEALKAQAVLARTFELKAGHGNMTAVADFSQNSAPVRAVKETAGLVLKYNGELASVFYHADSGGICSTSENVWGGKNLPYLVCKKDVFTTKSPNILWKKEYSKAEFEALLLKNGITVGTLLSFSNIMRDESGRIKSLDIVGTAGSINIKGSKLRSLAGLKSTLVNFGNEPPAYSLATVSDGTAESNLQAELFGTPERKSRKIDRSKMPQDKQDRLLWFADNDVISVEELMNMLAKPENIDEQLSYCMKKLDAAATDIQENKDVAEDFLPKQPASQEHVAAVAVYPSEYRIEDTIQFTGRGWGHGVGLPQWEAKSMAENGWSYTQILEYYFPGLTLEHY